MASRPSDPNTRRLRRFVLLVIFAVTLPSLMLSGFGLIAINNERDAARQRIYELYEPVIHKLALRTKARLKQIVQAGEEPLAGLIGWGLREGPPPRGPLARFLPVHTSLVNFFVLDAGGQQQLPRSGMPTPSYTGYFPSTFSKARQLEFGQGRPLQAARLYRSLLGEVDGVTARCRMVNAVRLGLGRPELFPDDDCQAAEPGGAEPWLRCEVRNALARSLDRAGRTDEALAEWGRLADGCQRYVAAGGYNLALGARLRRLELLADEPWDRLQPEAAALGSALADPLLPAASDQRRFVARRAADLLRGVGDGRARALRGLFEQVGTGDALGEAVAELLPGLDEGTALRSVQVDGVRRMLVIHRGPRGVAGAEVVATMLEPSLQNMLDELEIGGGALARLRPATQPHPDDGGVMAGSVLLTDGQFAWRLDLTLQGGDALDELTRTRTRLYLWGLILLVLVLGMGIAGTVWVMVRETRLSRLKTDFVSSVSHELRTPLTSIRLFTETLLLQRAGSEEEQREFLQIISSESERLSRLVERILDFSRMEAGRKAYTLQPVPIGELVELACTACRSLAEQRQAVLQVELPDRLPDVPGDRDALVEVLINLLSNAIKYSPEGSPVRISAATRDKHMEIAVTDQGIGIPRTEQDRIFDKFYRVESPLASEVSGSGLGLSLVRYILDGHNGTVMVDSAPGKGSTFTVRLPLGREAAGGSSG